MKPAFIISGTVLATILMSGLLHAQGDLDPPSGTPTPTMRTLNEVFEAVGKVTPLAPSALIELTTSSAISGNSSANLSRITSTGSNAGTYTVPTGSVLVITDLVIVPESYSASSIVTFKLQQNNNTETVTRRTFHIPGDRPFSIALRSGMVFGSGASLTAVNGSPGGAASIRVVMHGYVADDE